MGVSQTKQFKEIKKDLRTAEQVADEMAVEYWKEAFFKDNVPGWLRFLMKHSFWLTKRLGYYVSHDPSVKAFPPRMILAAVRNGKNKLLAKNF